MLSYYLQVATALCLFLVGCLALAITRRLRPGSDRLWVSWRLVAVAFTMFGANGLLHNAFGGIAILRGPQSRVTAAFIELMPTINHSRTFLMIGFGLGLCVLSFWNSSDFAGFWRIAIALLVGGLLFGAWIGYVEGPFVKVPHLTAVAVWDVVELVLLLSALFIMLVRSAVDRHLWALVGFYAVSLALGIFWFSILTLWGNPGSWTPPLWSTGAVRLVLYLIMLSFVVRRLMLARANVAVPALLDSPRIQPSLLH